ncbi:MULTISPECIES: RagB/SusD family nutrient uptake outer membrane protein [unclassified Salegentibacter]|uniref:RagB/SusD family nutrient uptake outer membrane protein n=1 Tax=unclassified Salegentibacter TaxID=2633436 RepID=UPI001E61F5CD|nr:MULTISPECIES: RagB/SusD family nutrient uptake outer membrane protein [unclassified Salegentibacter]
MKNIGYFLLLLFAVVGCNDDFVDTQPLDEFSQSDVWVDAALAEAFVLEIYNGLGQGGFDEQMMASLSDEALFTHPGRGINTITESRSGPAERGFINYTYNWGDLYGRIRAANIALENLEEPGFDDPDMVNQLRGEALFLRAYYYHNLLRMHGGVPIVDKVYTLDSEDLEIPRNTFEETVEFIVSDLDSAKPLLEGLNVDGRASMEAALALKARVLLYAASDLHDIPTASANSSDIAGYSNPEYLGYVSGNQQDRWRRAQAAAKEVVDLNRGYKMDLIEPVSAEEGKENYMALSLGGGSVMADPAAATELLFARYFVAAKNESGQQIGLYNGPNGYHNWAGNAPTQNLVDHYELIDGNEFNWNNSEHANNPYDNRDPRFYATILYDGADWKPRTADVAGSDPFDQIQTGTYEVKSGTGETITHNGLDTRSSAIEDWNGTHTGYYVRKFTDPDPAIVDQNVRQQIPFPFLKYTEAVLNYVEASIELGEEDMAKEWLNKIRYRAGMPAITASGQDLMEQYRQERLVELVYEEHRFHDARRWMIAPQTLGQQVRIIDVEGFLKPGANIQIYRYDPSSYNYEYEVRDLSPGIENREWLDKMYFIAIPRDEMNRNDQLIQNPGY